MTVPYRRIGQFGADLAAAEASKQAGRLTAYSVLSNQYGMPTLVYSSGKYKSRQKYNVIGEKL